MATQKAVAEHLDLSDRQVRDLAARGVIPNGGRGTWDLDGCRIGYVRHLRALASGHRSDGSGDEDEPDLIAERARLARVQADKIEMENAVTRSELLRREEVVLALQTTFARVRSRLLGLPTRAAALVLGLTKPAEVKSELTALVHEALAELAATRIVAEDEPLPETAGVAGDGGRRQRRAAGVDAAAKPDGERVGGPKPRAERGGQRRSRKVADKPR